jgi:hypothetical protein
MSPKVLTAACVGAQIILLAVCFNGLSATQGWGISIESPIHFEAGHRTPTAWAPVYFVCWFAAQMAILILSLEQLARHQDRPAWLRMPSLGGLSETSGSPFGYRLHQALVILIPLTSLYAGGHFVRVTLGAKVICEPAICWLDDTKHGVQFFPPWESWAFCAGYLGVAMAWIYILWQLARKLHEREAVTQG